MTENSGPNDPPAGARGEVRRIESAVPAWLRETDGENRFAAAAAIVVAIALQLLLPQRLRLHPSVLLPSVEVVLLVVLVLLNPVRLTRATRAARRGSVLLVAVITVDNAFSAGFLDYDLVTGKAGTDAASLLMSAAAIYLTNIIAFGLWYWEYDRGGPFARAVAVKPTPDFLFPQMSDPSMAPSDWEPTFVDYLYVSFTNATAFSPTDTLPLSRWAKALMALQSAVALTTVALVIARAVNVLK